MLHVIHQRSWPFEGSALDHALRDLGVPFRVLSSFLDLRAGSRLGLLVQVYPRLAWNTLRLGFRSLLLTRPAPDAIMVWTEVEALLIGLLHRLVRRRCRVLLQTLIITPRRSPVLRRLHLAYWWLVLAAIDVGTCHGEAETARYRAMFPRFADKLVYVPFGMTVDSRVGARPPGPHETPVLVTAGRSGRDYPTLVRAIEGLDCRVVIICDMVEPVAALPPLAQVEIRRDCFGADYLAALASASVVVVPLAVDEISAGQMVFLQAAALGRPIIMTRTTTTTDYAVDRENAWLVSRADVAAMREAILALLRDPALAERLGQAARARFRSAHSTEAMMRTVVAALEARGATLARS